MYNTHGKVMYAKCCSLDQQPEQTINGPTAKNISDQCRKQIATQVQSSDISMSQN